MSLFIEQVACHLTDRDTACLSETGLQTIFF